MPGRSDRFVTVYGRMPVLEALRDHRVRIDKVLVARTARGESVDEILEAAGVRGLRVQRVSPERITRLSGNGRHDQGVVADVVAPGLAELDGWLADRSAAGGGAGSLLVLDGVTNPANVGMIIRTAAAAGLDGVVLPRAGCPDVGPLVIKASAGVAFFAPVLRSPDPVAALDALSRHGWEVYGLRGRDAPSLWETSFARSAALVLGNETAGISAAVAPCIERWVAIPLAGGVESLNVACAAAVVSYELARRTVTAS